MTEKYPFSGSATCFFCFHEAKRSNGQCSYCGETNTANQRKYPLSLPQETVIKNRYYLGAVTGQSPFAIHYLAFDLKEQRKVKMKEFFPEKYAVRTAENKDIEPYPGEGELFFFKGKEEITKEEETLSGFHRPELPEVIEVFSENQTVYSVSEYVEGISFLRLNGLFGGRIPPKQLPGLYFPVLQVLSELHRSGVFHLDIYPEQLLVSDNNRICLVNFGAAKCLLSRKCGNQRFLYTGGYAPKEIFLKKGEMGSGTDIYSVAACMYYSLTGKNPPDALSRIENDPLAPLSAIGIFIPHRLEEIVFRGMQVNTKDRYSSVEEFQAELFRFSTDGK